MKSHILSISSLVALGSIGLSGCEGNVEVADESVVLQQAACTADDGTEDDAGILDEWPGPKPDGAWLLHNLHPIVNCVAPGDNDEMVAHFGYENLGETTLTIPVGRRNAFHPPPFDRGQPTSFAPGRSDNVVSAAFDARRRSLQWKLGRSRAIARRDAPLCVPSFAGATSAAVVSDTEIALTWAAATDYTTPAPGIVYDICVSTTPGSCAASFAVAQSTAAGETSSTVAGLMANTAYFFVVRARNAAGTEDTNTVEVGAQTCVAGDRACNGTCVSLASDPANCGACGNACAGGLCSSGACCAAGQSVCNGACTSVASDAANCGACGNQCPAGSECAAGQCVNPCSAWLAAPQAFSANVSFTYLYCSHEGCVFPTGGMPCCVPTSIQTYVATGTFPSSHPLAVFDGIADPCSIPIVPKLCLSCPWTLTQNGSTLVQSVYLGAPGCPYDDFFHNSSASVTLDCRTGALTIKGSWNEIAITRHEYNYSGSTTLSLPL